MSHSFKCTCNTVVHLNLRADQNQTLPLNVVCFKCFQNNGYDLFLVTYQSSPKEDTQQQEVVARTEEEAITVIKSFNEKDNEFFTIVAVARTFKKKTMEEINDDLKLRINQS